jgi:hypothetical protein
LGLADFPKSGQITLLGVNQFPLEA